MAKAGQRKCMSCGVFFIPDHRKGERQRYCCAAKWTCFHLYVILDIFSRCVVGWLIAIEPGTLTLHADRGASRRSKPVAALLVDLDIATSHSRPQVSDDNPYSES